MEGGKNGAAKAVRLRGWLRESLEEGDRLIIEPFHLRRGLVDLVVR